MGQILIAIGRSVLNSNLHATHTLMILLYAAIPLRMGPRKIINAEAEDVRRLEAGWQSPEIRPQQSREGKQHALPALHGAIRRCAIDGA